MTVEKIYFDMDGVLADFSRGVREILGMEPMDQGRATKDYDDRLFHAIMEHKDFYMKLEPVKDAIEMIRTVIWEYGDRVEVLTGIPKPERGIAEAARNKEEWIRKYVSPDIIVNTVRRADKKDFCKGEGYVLIDDYRKNIEEWEDVGGTGILFEHAIVTMNEVLYLNREKYDIPAENVSFEEYCRLVEKSLFVGSYHYSMEEAGNLVNRNLDEIRSYYDEGESSGDAAALAGYCCG